MPFPLFLALRYLLPKRSYLSFFITLFCVIGVMLGVGALIVVISIFNGFEKKVKEELLKMEPHIAAQQTNREMGEGAEKLNWRAVAESLRTRTDHALSVSPVVEAPATLDVKDIDGEQKLDPVTVTAIDANTSPLKKSIDLVAGEFDLESGDNAIISEQLAMRWNIMVGDKITIQSFKNAENALRMIEEQEKLPKDKRKDSDEWTAELKEAISPSELTVAGIFHSLQRPDMVLTPLHIGQEMTGKRGDISYLSVITPDAFNVGPHRDGLLDALPSNWFAETWRERHRAHFDAIESERGLMWVMLAMILVVSGFCIAVTLITIAIQKRREIGIVSSLGAKWTQVVQVFLWQGVIVGLIGVGAGIAGGLAFLAVRMNIKNAILKITGMEIMDPAVYGVPEIPCEVRTDDVMVIAIGALIMSALAALVPAFIAAWQDPAKSLRSE